MADLPSPWHLVKPGAVLEVHCGAPGPITRVRSRWLATCEACLAASEPCAPLSEAGLDRLLEDVIASGEG